MKKILNAVNALIFKDKDSFIKFLKNKSTQYSITLAILLWVVIFGLSITSSLQYHGIRFIVLCIISSAIVSVAISLILVALPRRIYSLYPILFALFTILLYVNSIYSRFFGGAIPRSMYSQVSNLVAMDSSIVTSLFRWSDFILIIAILAAFILLPRMARNIGHRLKFSIPLLLSTLILLVLSWGVLIKFYGGTIIEQYQESKVLAPIRLNFMFSLPLVIGVEIFAYNVPYVSKEQYNLAKHYIATIAKQNISEIGTIAGKPRSLIVILVESLNSDALCMEAMPFTYSLSQDSTNIFIPNIEEAIGVGNSMDGQLLTLTGLSPNKSQFTFAFSGIEYDFPSIVKSLNTKANYKSILSTITDTTMWMQHIAARAMGIEKQFGNEEYKSSEWLDDKTLFSNVIENLDNLDKETPFCYIILTGDSHAPFNPNDKPIYPLPSGLNKDRGYYYTALQRTDREIANLFSYLRDKEILEQTSTVIVADHCVSDVYLGGGVSIMPLLIVNPLNNPKYRPQNNTSQVSIFPTIMHAMGIVDSTYMGLTPSMLSPCIDSLTESDFRKIEEVSMAIIYGEVYK